MIKNNFLMKTTDIKNISITFWLGAQAPAGNIYSNEPCNNNSRNTTLTEGLQLGKKKLHIT